MNLHVFFQYFQFFFSIGLALLVFFRLRKPLSAMIVQMMPIKTRVSDEFFNIQARISLMVGIILALIIAAIIYSGFETVEHRFAKPAVEQTLVPSRSSERPQPMSEPIEENQPATNPTTAPDDDNNTMRTDTLPIQGRQKKFVANPLSEPKASLQSVAESEDFFLQLHAYKNYDFALHQFEYLGQQLDRRVWLTRIEGEAVPYKLVVGPFPSRASLRRYQSQHGLDGWVRKRKELIFEHPR